PDVRNLFFPDVQEAGPDRGRQPLVKAGAVVVAVELVTRERKRGEGMGAVDDDFDPLRTGEAHDLLDGEDLPGQVRDVADVDDLGLRRDSGGEARDQIVGRRGWHGEGDLLQDDPLAADPLLPGRDHPGVVLRGGQYLVALVQGDPHLDVLEGFAGISRDRHLLRIAAEGGREAAPDSLDLGLEHRPHVDRRRVVRELDVPLQGVLDHAGAWSDAAVVEIDQRAVDVERLLNRHPEVFILGDRGRGTALDARHHPLEVAQGVVAKRGNGGGGYSD